MGAQCGVLETKPHVDGDVTVEASWGHGWGLEWHPLLHP